MLEHLSTAVIRSTNFAFAASCAIGAFAQNELQIHGNFNADGYLYQEDSAIGATPLPQDFGFNAWGNVIINYGAFESGLRFESYEPALLGYPAGQPYKGSGIGYRYVKYHEDDLEVTVGSFFEQFGSGMAFRSYEERYLGVDNAMDGARVKYMVMKGLHVKGIIGTQRFGFDSKGFTKGPGIVRGIDAEFHLADWCDSLAAKGRNLIIGGNFVSKYQEDRDPIYVLPENVGVWSGRLNYTTAKWNLLAEYAYKINDPNSQNDFIYKDGQGVLFNATYSVSGLGVSAGVHSFDNMSFQSDRSAPTPFDLNINFLPPLAKQHTYNLAATLYPYATQPNGEVAWQGEVFYKWKKGSKLGGKYGTKLAINYSAAYSLDSTLIANDEQLEGYRTQFGVPGEELYFSDFNVEVRKKLSSTWELALTYINLVYNIDVVQGKPGKPSIYADMGVAEGLYKFNDENSVRFEVQHLSTRQDHGNWATLLAEFTFSPHWSLTAMDQYNYGGGVDVDEIHYPLASMAYTRGANRFQVNYGRQRAGIFCVGGVCRQVPAASGLAVSITSTF